MMKIKWGKQVMMNSQVTRLVEMFRTASHGKTWHGQSVFETLQNISAEEAAAHPIPNSHSIWDYLLHMINWREFAMRTILDDEPYIVDLNTEKDWTTITDFSDSAWENALELFKKSTDDLSAALKTLKDQQLDEIVPEHKFTFYTLLQGVIQHDIYHSGQIVLLKKILKNKV